MTTWQRWASQSRAALSFGLAFGLAGCSVPIDLYHGVEGGAISQARQPPPGADAPYPNLADVPAAPAATPPGTQALITQQAHMGVSAPNPGALAGLTLPLAAPPPPSGVVIQAPAAPAPAPAAPAAPPPNPPPVAFAFAPGSALLPVADAAGLARIAKAYNGTRLRVGGFGEGSFTLALARAQRLADALTADGIPASALQLCATAQGSGGFVQLVY